MKKTPAVFVITLLFVAILTLSVNGQTQGPFVGSKESDVYHYTSCSYVSNIKEENKVWFTDAQDAVNHGYHPCLRCKPPLPSLSTPSPTATPLPSISPTPIPIPTVMPTPTATPSVPPVPTVSPTPDAFPTSTPTTSTPTAMQPTPTIPEFNTAIILLILILCSGAALIAKKKHQQQNNKREN